jgi:uncharacterized repeat protein (TIGR03806 family)
VANGKVYVGSQGQVSVFGLADGWTAPPSISPNGGTFSGSISVSMIEKTPGASIYYTLDGSTPTLQSARYTGPVTVSKSGVLKAFATAPSLLDSPVVSATFIENSVVGLGTGLTGLYWSNQLRTTNGTPNLRRVDPTVDFNWGSGSPAANISADHFTALWTGQVQAQFSETYTFYTTTDDGARLRVNGQLLINKWQDQGATEWSGTIALVAGQKYDVALVYYENTGSAVAQLSWSSPSTTKEIIPQSQLYPGGDVPPSVRLSNPASGSVSVADAATIFVSADASDANGTIQQVAFYASGKLIGTLSNAPYAFTWTKVAPGSYSLTAVATNDRGIQATSDATSITVQPGSGQPYGLTNRLAITPYLKMPTTAGETLPALLSQTGAFADLTTLAQATGLLPYDVAVPLWSDGAVKTRWMAVPNRGATFLADQQISFASTGEWAFPAGTVFVKHFELVTDETHPDQRRRLETRLLVRDANGGVYGVTYKWRSDNSDADLLTSSLTEDIVITASSGVRTQSWFYPGPQDCLTCHNPAAHYVLGVKARQLNHGYYYPDSGRTDNQLRTLNQLGLFSPPITDENDIATFPALAGISDSQASLEQRARSYLDANCAQCHRPGGLQANFDLRYDTPLANQNLINAVPLKGNLGYDNTHLITPKDPWRSVVYDRMNALEPLIKMPPLARNVVDQDAVALLASWIDSLPGTPALAPPSISPSGGTGVGSLEVVLQHGDPLAQIRFTLDGSLPSSTSPLYAGALILTNSTMVTAKAFEAGFNDSVAASASFTVRPPIHFHGGAYFGGGQFRFLFDGLAGKTYLLQASTNLLDWANVTTNIAPADSFPLADPEAVAYPYQFYRVLELP